MHSLETRMSVKPANVVWKMYKTILTCDTFSVAQKWRKISDCHKYLSFSGSTCVKKQSLIIQNDIIVLLHSSENWIRTQLSIKVTTAVEIITACDMSENIEIRLFPDDSCYGDKYSHKKKLIKYVNWLEQGTRACAETFRSKYIDRSRWGTCVCVELTPPPAPDPSLL